MSTVSIDTNNLEARVAALKSAAEQLEKRALNSTDGETTITANQNAQAAFQIAQSANIYFSRAIIASATQILAIGKGFVDLDGQAASTMGLN